MSLMCNDNKKALINKKQKGNKGILSKPYLSQKANKPNDDILSSHLKMADQIDINKEDLIYFMKYKKIATQDSQQDLDEKKENGPLQNNLDLSNDNKAIEKEAVQKDPVVQIPIINHEPIINHGTSRNKGSFRLKLKQSMKSQMSQTKELKSDNSSKDLCQS